MVVLLGLEVYINFVYNNTILHSLLVSGAPAEVYIHHLDAAGIYVSAGSACQSGKKEVSQTYFNMGLTAESAKQMLRLLFSY